MPEFLYLIKNCIIYWGWPFKADCRQRHALQERSDAFSLSLKVRDEEREERKGENFAGFQLESTVITVQWYDAW